MTDPASGADPHRSPGDPPLPDLNEALLDEETVQALFRDLAACAEILEVVPKIADRTEVTGAKVSLAEGQALLAEGRARGLQVRYRFEGAEWWDTLLRTPRGIRLVRIRHDFGEARREEGG